MCINRSLQPALQTTETDCFAAAVAQVLELVESSDPQPLQSACRRVLEQDTER